MAIGKAARADPTKMKGEIMANSSVAGQSAAVPELVEILKRLGAHRQRAWKQTYGKEQWTREESDEYWRHPLLWACKWLEQRLGIKREDLEVAALRLNTPLGLRGMDDLPGPNGTTDKGQPDWLWMVPKFRKLDRDGTTAKLWQSLQEDYPEVADEDATTESQTLGPNGAMATEENAKRAQSDGEPKVRTVGDLLDLARADSSDKVVTLPTKADFLAYDRLLAHALENHGDGLSRLEVLNRLVGKVANAHGKRVDQVRRLSLSDFWGLFQKSQSNSHSQTPEQTEGNNGQDVTRIGKTPNTAASKGQKSEEPSERMTPDEPLLSERAQLVLQVLLREKRLDSDQRMRTADIAVKASGKGTDANAYKEVISSLKGLGYVNTKEGRGGGCWLTAAGNARAEKL